MNLCTQFFFVFALEDKNQIKISEISPVKIEEDEWFEIQILPNEKIWDLTNFELSNGQYSPKKFTDFQENIHLGDNLKNLAGKLVNINSLIGSGATFTGSGNVVHADKDALLFSLIDTQKSGFFYIKPSPFSLPDSGGNLTIFEREGSLIDRVNFPKSKTKTKSGKKVRAEIWNRNFNGTNLDLYPIWHGINTEEFQHSRGKENVKKPSFSEEVKILISEISPNNPEERGGDFVEILVQSGVEQINLKYARLKHNGSIIWESNADFFIKSGDRIVIYPEKGISAGSGTWEFWLWSDTSFEEIEDFVCYKNKNLSQTEEKRVENFRETGDWKGSCIDIAELVKGESIARVPNNPDTNSTQDFFRHFLGSPRAENINNSQNPQAVIDIQRSGKIIGTPPFSLNVTGENSFDPDGNFDIKNFTWKKNGEIFSEVENPGAIKIETLGNYIITLEVEDFTGNKGKDEVTISVVKSVGAVPTFQRKKYASQNWKKSQKAFQKRYKYISGGLNDKQQEDLFQEKYNNFFDDFLAEAPDDFFINQDRKKHVTKKTDIKFQTKSRENTKSIISQKIVNLSVKGMVF